jgi:hypothetical protein
VSGKSDHSVYDEGKVGMIIGVGKALLSVLMFLLVANLPVMPLLAAESGNEAVETLVVPSWLEPHGLHVVDLVGTVPEEQLRDAIVSASPSTGIVKYMEGKRDGNEVTIKVRLFPRYHILNTTFVGCLNHRVYSDYWPTVVPASRMQLFAGNANITSSIFGGVIAPAGLVQPIRGAIDQERYAEPPIGALESGDEFVLPANRGCLLFLEGRHTDMTAIFTFDFEPAIQVQWLGQETFSFGGYRGIGYSGIFEPLQNQLQQYGEQHDKFRLNIPSRADYMIVKFPPSTVGQDAIDDLETNVRQPASGTYRLASGASALSVDHNISMGLPIHAMWQDADQAGASRLRLLPGIDTLTSPEYFVPVGIEYDPCMTSGDCPESLMEQILSQRAELTVYYYRVERIQDGLTRVRLRPVGPQWSPGLALAAVEEGVGAGSSGNLSGAPVLSVGDSSLYLPTVSALEERTGCPCGWFTQDGRMVDYTPGPAPILTPEPTPEPGPTPEQTPEP